MWWGPKTFPIDLCTVMSSSLDFLLISLVAKNGFIETDNDDKRPKTLFRYKLIFSFKPFQNNWPFN